MVATLVLVGFDRVYRQPYGIEYAWPRNVLPNTARDPLYQIVKTGNSHSQDGITFQRYRAESLDLSGVAQRFETDLAVLKQHHREIAPGAVVIIPVTPLSFSHTAVNSQRGFQAGYYGRVSPFFIPHLNWGDYIESQVFPFARSVHNLRKRYASQVQERISAEEKWPDPTPSPTPVSQPPAPSAAPVAKQKVRVLRVPEEERYFVVEAIQAELATPSAISHYRDNTDFMFNKWLHTDEFSTEYFDENRRDLEKLIEYSLRQQWRPVLVMIPITASFVDALPDEYLQEYVYEQLEKTDTQGVEVLDYLEFEPITSNQRLFGNVDHLEKAGRSIFSYVLLQDLISRGYLTADIDGYDYDPLYIEVWQ